MGAVYTRTSLSKKRKRGSLMLSAVLLRTSRVRGTMESHSEAVVRRDRIHTGRPS